MRPKHYIALGASLASLTLGCATPNYEVPREPTTEEIIEEFREWNRENIEQYENDNQEQKEEREKDHYRIKPGEFYA